MSKVLSQPNGTTTTGRTSSVISIYDYPEHLNPFYEDEQHKRLRFWTTGKDKKKGRSNSFSLDSIKDWTFKSFRLKKRSSTLGINKTSESPPQLRRQAEPYNSSSHYNTYDSRTRNTVAVGLNSTYPNTFQRGGPLRSSLQDRTNPNNEFFIRNNRYRNTVQPSNTSTPIMKHRNGIGTSQTSLNSTNPFDEDDNMSLSSVNTMNKPSRKKRRAPPPPVAIPSIQTTAPSDEDTENTLEIHNLTSEIESFVRNTNDDEYYTKHRDDEVKAQNHQPSSQHIEERITINQSINEDVNDKPAKTATTTHVTEDERQKIKITVIKPIENATSIEINENVNLKSNDKEKITPDKTLDLKQQQDKQSIDENLDDPKMNQKIEIEKKFVVPSTPETVYIRKSQVTEVKEINVRQEVKKVETETEENHNINSGPQVTPRKKKSKPLNELKFEHDETHQMNKPLQTPLSSNCEDILESTTPNMKKQKFDLRISESETSLDEKPNNNSRTKIPSSGNEPKTIKTENYEFKIRYKPLSDDNSMKESRYDQWTRELRRNNSDDSIHTPSPSPRRRSVKDIIESINKNQRLLKINQTDAADETKTKEEILAITESTDSLTRNLTHLLEEEKKITNFLSELDNQPANKKSTNISTNEMENNINARGSYYDNIPTPVVQINTNEVNNNMDVDDFKMRDKSKLDWNPVPKPRRSRHFSEDNKVDVTKVVQKDT